MKCLRSQKTVSKKDLEFLKTPSKLKENLRRLNPFTGLSMKKRHVDRRQFNMTKREQFTAKAFKLIKNMTIFLDLSTTNIRLARKLLAASNMRVVVVSI